MPAFTVKTYEPAINVTTLTIQADSLEEAWAIVNKGEYPDDVMDNAECDTCDPSDVPMQDGTTVEEV